jgi:hypothetical protein
LELAGPAFKISFLQVAITDFETDLLRRGKWAKFGQNAQKVAWNCVKTGKIRPDYVMAAKYSINELQS